MLAHASKRHQKLAGFLAQTLGIFVKARDLGVMLSVPFQVKTGPELLWRQPDTLFIAKEYLSRLEETHLDARNTFSDRSVQGASLRALSRAEFNGG